MNKLILIILCLCISSPCFAVVQAVNMPYRITNEGGLAITNDKYDECIKDIIKEIAVYKKIVNELTKMKLNIMKDEDKDIFASIHKEEILQECINKLNENIKSKISELIDKLK